MLEKTAYLLVYHGSRDPRPQQEAGVLAQKVRERLTDFSSLTQTNRDTSAVLTRPSQPLVYTAALELAPLPLEKAIEELMSQLSSKGITELQVIPLFLLPGVHVREDIPNAVSQAQQQGGNSVSVRLTPYLGESLLMGQKLREQLKTVSSARIIVSHGSRRPGGHQPIEVLGTQLDATLAYWSVAPTVTEQVETLVQQGKQSIEIIPYFLFPGGITDSIEKQIQALKNERFPQLQYHFHPPLCHRLSLASIIVNDLLLV